MKYFITLAIILVTYLFTSEALYSQEITFEDVQKICDSNIPINERIRISVTNFTSRKRSLSGDLGEELATILSNALFEVHCFDVLASADNLGDFEKEYKMNKKSNTNPSSSIKDEMLGAQAIVTAEITEYAEGKKGFSFSGLKVGKNKAHVGFVLKVLDPKTRQTLFSKSINMEGTSNGFSGLSAFGLNAVGSSDKSKALNNAVEKAIIKATEVLAKSKDRWGIKIVETKIATQTITLEASNIDFASLLKLEQSLKTINGFKLESKTFEGESATLIISGITDSNFLAMHIATNLDEFFDVSGLSEDYVRIKGT